MRKFIWPEKTIAELLVGKTIKSVDKNSVLTIIHFTDGSWVRITASDSTDPFNEVNDCPHMEFELSLDGSEAEDEGD